MASRDSSGEGSDLYRRFEALKPAELAWTAWAKEAGLSSSFFTDVKKGASPSMGNVEKAMKAIGLTTGHLFQLPTQGRRAEEARTPKDVPVYGTGLGGRLEFEAAGGEPVAVEQTDLYLSSTLDWVRRMPGIANERDAYVILLQGNSMSPAFEDRDPAVVLPYARKLPGDYVLVQLRRPIDDDEEVSAALLKRLVRQTSSGLELEQFNPPLTFRVPADQVKSTYLVKRMADVTGL